VRVGALAVRLLVYVWGKPGAWHVIFRTFHDALSAPSSVLLDATEVVVHDESWDAARIGEVFIKPSSFV